MLVFLNTLLFAQDFNESLYMDPNEVENIDPSQWLEDRMSLLEDPVNLHKADYDDLSQAQILSQRQISDLLEHIQINGKLLSLYELQVISSFTLEDIKRILPYIKLSYSIDDYRVAFKALISQGDYQFFTRYRQSFPTKKGFTSLQYKGRPNQLYNRFKYQYSNKLYYGLTGEKDPGEKMFSAKSTLGFDFYSAYFFWRINKKIKTLALGDYHLNLGQGLIMYTGFGFNKTSNVSAIKKEGAILKPYSSINEYAFLRGAACTLEFRRISVTPFVSVKKVDASISYSDSTNSQVESLRIQESGLHRTSKELTNKNQLLEMFYGFNMNIRGQKSHIGLNLLQTQYSDSIKFNTRPYNQFQFQGKHLTQLSLDYHSIFKRAHIFGETALSIQPNEMGLAVIHGIILHPSKMIALSFLYRFYSPYFQSTGIPNAFGEGSSPINEHGLYMGISLQPSRKFSFATYLDYYKFPWLKYQVKQPSQGYDLLLSANYSPSKKLEFYMNYKREEKEANTRITLGENNSLAITSSNQSYLQSYFGDDINFDGHGILQPSHRLSKQEIESAIIVTPVLSQKIRIHIAYTIKDSWVFQSRFESSFLNDQINRPSRGILIYQDIKFKSIKIPVSISARFSLFDIRQFNNRIYSYESDVLGQFSIPSFFNAGTRFYLNFQYRMNKHVQAWLKFSHTYYKDIDSKGTGNEEILSNKLYDLKVQLRLKF